MKSSAVSYEDLERNAKLHVVKHQAFRKCTVTGYPIG
jgi:hypothetical protein